MTSLRLASTTAVCLFLLSACGGGSAPASTPLPPPEGTSPPAASLTISGRTTKGPVAGARIELFEVDARGRAVGAPIATALTDARGDWSANVPANHGGLLLRSAGGVFVDEADPVPNNPRRIELAPDDVLLSFLPPGAQQASVTLLSHALVRKSLLEVDADNFAERLAANRSRYGELLQLDPLLTASADPLEPTGTADEQRYALLAGGLAYALNALAIDSGRAVADFATIEQLLLDLLDCRLDGVGLGGQSLYDVAAFGGRNLNDEILRFRNNHAAAYTGVALPQLDAAGCPAAADALDAQAPVFRQPLLPLTLAALDAAGAAVADPAIDAALAAVVVDDNRDDQVHVSADLPGRFALGATNVTLRAVDAWGNQSSVIWPVTVTDQAPPQLTVPADVVVDATSVRTPVALGQPSVSDNVSTSLNVSNDAPAEGFGVGDTEVTWRAVDAAGLVAEGVQRVTVIGAVPVVNAAFVPPPLAVGAVVDVDLSVLFTDPFGAALSFALTGLPSGTGLVFDPVTGRLSGLPTSADRAASPLALAVTATNGQFEQTAAVELVIAPRVPEFALSTAQLLVEEDFATGPIVEIEPLVPIPPAILSIDVDVTPPLADVQFTSPDALQLLARPNDNGQATLTVTVRNTLTGEAASRQVALEVAPVNDPPAPVAPAIEREVAVGAPVVLDLNESFVDVDGDALAIIVDGLPQRLTLNSSGQLVGQLLESDARAGRYLLNVRAEDGAGLAGTLDLAVQPIVPDADGDGLSDAREREIGTDPQRADTDGDGVDDALEVLALSDPLRAAAQVLFVAHDGDNANDGRSPEQALRDLNGLGAVPSGTSAAQPTFVLFAAGDAAYSGTLNLSGDCRHIVLAGAVPAGVTFTAQDGAPVTLRDCVDVHILRASFVGNRFGALAVNNGSLRLREVTLRGNSDAALAPADGAGLRATNVLLDIDGLIASNNVSSGFGGALAVDGGTLTLRNARMHANRATLGGGAVYVTRPRARASVFNALFVGNSAPNGAAILAARSGQLDAQNITAVGQRVGDAGAAFAAVDGALIALTDCVLADNLTTQGAQGTTGQNTGTNYCSADRPPSGPNDTRFAQQDQAFGASFALREGSGGVDTGSVAAVAVALSEAFSRDASADPDLGVLDRGYHYRNRPQLRPLQPIHSVFANTDDVLVTPGQRAVTVTPEQDGAALGPGYRVRYALGEGGEAFSALDLADGRYAAVVTSSADARALRWWVGEVPVQLD